MNSESDEKDLQELFDRTAATPNARALERLASAARAAAHAPQRKGRRLWPPAAVAVAVAVVAGAPLLFRVSAPEPRERLEALEHAVAGSPASSLGAPPATLEVTTTSADAEAEFSDEGAADVLDDLALDPGDLSDAELDAWIATAGSTLDG